jgi:hypothetical protein
MCISDVFAPASEKCTYENDLFLENICAQRLSEAVFDENAHIKTDFSRVSYVHTTVPAIFFEEMLILLAGQ